MNILYVYLFFINLLVSTNSFLVPLLYNNRLQLRKSSLYMISNKLYFPNIENISQNDIRNVKNITDIFILTDKSLLVLCKNNSKYYYNNSAKILVSNLDINLEKLMIHYVSNKFITFLNNSNFSRL